MRKAQTAIIVVVAAILALALVAAGYVLGHYLSNRIDLGTLADEPASSAAAPPQPLPAIPPQSAEQVQSAEQLKPIAEAQTAGDLGWLTASMESCERDAAGDQAKVYFMVVPLVAADRDDRLWAQKAFDRAGQALLLNSEDALAGLRSGALRIDSDAFTFSILDPRSSSVSSWKSKVGASKLASANADTLAGFRMRIHKGEDPGSAQWGTLFSRLKGSCHWVNALFAP